MTKEERLNFLIHKKNKLNEEVRTIDDFFKFDSFVNFEIANEELFVKEHPEMSDSFMLSRLKNVQVKLKSAKELIRKNKSKRAFDPFEVAFRHLNQDYDSVIGVFKSKNNL
ncbi:MAG: hypothetical protein ACP5DQ_12265 [Bacteroidales bacterium]